MTFYLIRFELNAAYRQMNFAGPGSQHCRLKRPQKTLEEREKMIEDIHKRIDAQYLQHCDMTVPCVTLPVRYFASRFTNILQNLLGQRDRRTTRTCEDVADGASSPAVHQQRGESLVQPGHQRQAFCHIRRDHRVLLPTREE